MNKAQEIAVLEEAVKKLGPNSYLGPWLQSISAEVANEIRCDIFPSPSLRLAEDHCRTLRKTADDYYSHRIEEAKAHAEQIRKDAHAEARDIAASYVRGQKANLGQVIRDLQRTLGAL